MEKAVKHWLILGDARQALKRLKPESIQCVVTSPPYFGLRSYDVAGQIGLENDLSEYIETLVSVFQDIWRVLRKDGCVWLNLGDSYAGNARAGDKVFGNPEFNKNRPSRAQTKTPAKQVPRGMKPRDLMMVPHRVAIALQAAGWYVRSDVIWSKNNPVPESTISRPTKSHEYVFLLSKSEKYYFDVESIMEPSVSDHPSGNGFVRNARLSFKNSDGSSRGSNKQWEINTRRRRRSVWTIATKPFKDAHFAVMPEALAELCILSGSSPGSVVLDPFAGACTTGVVCERLGRKFIGVDLKKQYLIMGRKRMRKASPCVVIECRRIV
jgi:DNA modification methylase